MEIDYKCPYCGRNSYAKSSRKPGKYTDWKSVVRHTSSCNKNDNSFIVTNEYGPISIEEIITTDPKKLKQRYPKTSFYDKIKHLKKLGKLTNIPSFKITHTKESIISSIIDFYNTFSRLPGIRDFSSNNPSYPNHDTVKTHFGSWNAAIEAAGFIPNIQNGFGINTRGLDAHLYRSSIEAYFCDTYLFGTYEYIIEPRYPEPYYKFYDWYIPSLDLYIELDGGIRPETTKEKININNILNRKCLFLDTDSIYNRTYVEQYLKSRTWDAYPLQL